MVDTDAVRAALTALQKVEGLAGAPVVREALLLLLHDLADHPRNLERTSVKEPAKPVSAPRTIRRKR